MWLVGSAASSGAARSEMPPPACFFHPGEPVPVHRPDFELLRAFLGNSILSGLRFRPSKCSVIFVREKRRRNKNGSVVTYLQLVENKRGEEKTRQRGKKLEKLGWTGSFTELLAALGRVRVTVLQGKGGQTFRLRDEIPSCAMPALHAVRVRAPRRLERLD